MNRTDNKTFAWAMPTNYTAVIEVLMLMLVGATGVLLHAKLRIPMGMPGRHGVDFMLILIAAKFISGKQYSASIATSGSALALMLPFWGFTDPFMPAYYIIIGVLTDVFFAFPVKNRMNMLVLGAIAGGLAYATIPISRIIISSFAGIPFLSLMKNGLFIPVLYHFLFGAAGSIAGVAVARLIKRK